MAIGSDPVAPRFLGSLVGSNHITATAYCIATKYQAPPELLFSRKLPEQFNNRA